MPDFRLPLPIPGLGRPGTRTRITCANGTTHEFDYRPSWQELVALCGAPSATPSGPASPPSVDPLPTPQPLPTPDVLQQPSVQDVTTLASLALLAQAQAPNQRQRERAASGKLARSFAQAYGISSPLNMRRARRMARRRGTMRAQEDEIPGFVAPPQLGEPIDPRKLPVPTSVPTPDDFQRAIENEGRNRAQSDREVLRQAQQRNEELQRQRARSRSGRRSGTVRGVGVGVGVGVERGVEVLGEGLGSVIGEAIYGRTAEEAQRARELEDELDRRMAQETAPFPDEILVNGLPSGEIAFPIPAKLGKHGGPIVNGVEMRPMPTFPTPTPTPTPAKRNRVQRALSKLSQVTSNPWAQLGVFGLGLLGGRKSKRSSTAASSIAIADSIPDDLTAVSPGMLPFPYAGSASFSSAPQSTSCDCKPKRKGPKRRCIERADVSWRTGRYKGRKAGTKCVRWE